MGCLCIMLINENVHYANFPVRLFAYIIDLIIIGLALLFIKVPMFFVSVFSPNLFIFQPILFKFSFWSICLYLLTVAYFVLTQYFFKATLGKRIMRIKLISTDEKTSLLTIIYRETIGRYLSSLLFIGYLITFFTKYKQGLHDILSDTYVVYDFSNNNINQQYQPSIY